MRWNRLQHFYFLVADRLAIRCATGGSIARFDQHLKQMVLHHVADRSGLIVKSTAALNAEILRHRDLHALDVVAVPKRLQKSVGKAEEQHVVDRPFAEIMIDAKDVSFVEDAQQNPVQFLRGCEVVPEGLFHDDACAFVADRTSPDARRRSRTALAESPGSAPAVSRRRVPCEAQ